MGIRFHSFAVGEMYHCYNRGVEKRVVFNDSADFTYFVKGLKFYNTRKINVKMRDFIKKDNEVEHCEKNNKLVKIHAYCLNENHFHLLLENLTDGGVSKFMQKIATSYVMYFNKKNDRSGSLFQGKFKSVHIDSDEYLKHLGVYINLNNLVHGVKNKDKFRSSMHEYSEVKPDLCDITLIGDDIGATYESYAHTILPDILERKKLQKELIYSEFID